MSNAVYPTLPGLMFNFVRAPSFKTDIKTTPSGREFRGAQMLYPLYTYTLVYEFLRDSTAFNEFRSLLGFYNQRQGRFDSFLFNDTDDNTVTSQQFGVGDGATTKFQLIRTLGGMVEPVYDLNGAPQIYVSGVLKTVGTDYTINATGGVVFTVAPGATAPITWTGAFYWRVRFLTDEQEFSKMMQSIWEVKKLKFITVKP